MQLLIVIVKKASLVTDLCKELAEAGVHGGTIIDGVGMASIIENMDDLPIFGMLKSLLADDDYNKTVKTMLFVMKDEEIENARGVIQRTIGLERPNTGIMFAVPVSFVEELGA